MRLRSVLTSAFVLTCVTACGVGTNDAGGVVAVPVRPAANSSVASLAEQFQAAASGPYQAHSASLYVNGTVCIAGQGCTAVDGSSVPAPGGGWACDAGAVVATRQPHYPEMIAPAAVVTAWADRDASDDPAGASTVSTDDAYCPGLSL